jgi:hypothetical protein
MQDLTLLFVKELGRVRGNKLDTLSSYCAASDDEIISHGLKGVATWSIDDLFSNPFPFRSSPVQKKIRHSMRTPCGLSASSTARW